MGYTHDYTIPVDVDDEAWGAAYLDACKIIRACKKEFDLEVGADHYRGIWVNHRVEYLGRNTSWIETLTIPMDPHSEDHTQKFCKTSGPGDPGDKLVTAVLSVMAEAGMVLDSDGDEEDWGIGVNLCLIYLGRDVPNPMKREEDP